MQPKHIPFFSILSGITAIPKTGIPGIYPFCFHAEFIYYHDFASGIRWVSVSMQLKFKMWNNTFRGGILDRLCTT